MLAHPGQKADYAPDPTIPLYNMDGSVYIMQFLKHILCTFHGRKSYSRYMKFDFNAKIIFTWNAATL